MNCICSIEAESQSSRQEPLVKAELIAVHHLHLNDADCLITVKAGERRSSDLNTTQTHSSGGAAIKPSFLSKHLILICRMEGF